MPTSLSSNTLRRLSQWFSWGGVGTFSAAMLAAPAGVREEITLATAALSVGSLFVAGRTAAAERRRLHATISGLTDLNERLLQAGAQAVAQPPTQEEVVGYAAMLLTVQDAGRQIAGHLDLDMLVPTIITTARAALRCRYAAVYFWDSRTRTLHDAFPARSRDAGQFVPQPHSGATAWVLQHLRPLTASTIAAEPEAAAAVAEEPYFPAGVAPLLAGRELLGLLVVDAPDAPASDFDRLLSVIATLAALGLKNAQLFRRIEEAAHRDPLTGLLNRGGFDAATAGLRHGSAVSVPLTLILADLDRFKRLNDTHGHPAGDAVLREAARLWHAALPDSAITSRHGGEEFLTALPGISLPRGYELAESLRVAVAQHPFSYEGVPLNVTASFGVAAVDSHDPDLTASVAAADAALYRAKAAGRNRVEVDYLAATQH